MAAPDGGPIFPYVDPKAGQWKGMTRRDWFASTASDEDIRRWLARLRHQKGINPTSEQARFAYADAMIAASKEF